MVAAVGRDPSENCLLPFDRQKMVEPFAHRFLQIVIRAAEPGVAAGDEIVLLALQARPARGFAAGRVADHPGVHGVDLGGRDWPVPGLAQIAFSTALWRSRS